VRQAATKEPTIGRPPISDDAGPATIDVIYGAAVRLMAERGYHGTSLRDIATAANLRISSVYYHYPSKQSMLLAIIRRTMADLTTEVTDAVAGAGADPVEQFKAAIAGHVRFHAHRREEAFITDTELRSLDAESLEEVLGLRDAYERIVTDILRFGRAAGVFEIGDETVVKNALFTSMTGVAAWYRPEGRLSADAIASEVAELFLRSLAPSGATATRAGSGTHASRRAPAGRSSRSAARPTRPAASPQRSAPARRRSGGG
jgi:AcrR family transcriptional regulator